MVSLPVSFFTVQTDPLGRVQDPTAGTDPRGGRPQGKSDLIAKLTSTFIVSTEEKVAPDNAHPDNAHFCEENEFFSGHLGIQPVLEPTTSRPGLPNRKKMYQFLECKEVKVAAPHPRFAP